SAFDHNSEFTTTARSAMPKFGNVARKNLRCLPGAFERATLNPQEFFWGDVTDNRQKVGNGWPLAARLYLSGWFYWRSLGDSNPCFRRERATSWAARRRERVFWK